MKSISQIEPLLGNKEADKVSEYIKSGGWLTEHKKTKELEQRIGEFIGVKNVSLVNNGTIGLALSLMVLGIKGEVIVPDFTMIASANAVKFAGAEPVFCDIDPKTLCIDIDKIEITPRTEAVMVVDINGRSPNMEEVIKSCKQRGLWVVEDACQAFGSKHKGQYLGTFGDMGVFSFSPHKIFTMGQGGAIISGNDSFYENIEKLKDFGRLEGGKDIHPEIGFNFKFTDLQAIVGLEQMTTIQWRIKRKKEIYQLYRRLLEKTIEFIDTDLQETTPWFVDILVDNRESLIECLKYNGIETRPFYPAIHNQPIYSNVERFKNAEEISKRGLWLPSSLSLTDDDIEYICKTIKDFLR